MEEVHNSQKIQETLHQLSEEEKLETIFLLSNTITKSWMGIEKNQSVCSGDACIIRTRIPVWSLVLYKRQGWQEETFLKNFPTLRQSDLANAWIYYKLNKEEIDKAITENEAI